MDHWFKGSITSSDTSDYMDHWFKGSITSSDTSDYCIKGAIITKHTRGHSFKWVITHQATMQIIGLKGLSHQVTPHVTCHCFKGALCFNGVITSSPLQIIWYEGAITSGHATRYFRGLTHRTQAMALKGLSH
jgi:hypothetical protein